MALEWLVEGLDAHTDYLVVQKGDAHVDLDIYSGYYYFESFLILRDDNDVEQGWASRLVQVWTLRFEALLGF